MDWNKLLELLTELKKDSPDLLSAPVSEVNDREGVKYDLIQSLTDGAIKLVYFSADADDED